MPLSRIAALGALPPLIRGTTAPAVAPIATRAALIGGVVPARFGTATTGTGTAVLGAATGAVGAA
ncbi:hypothetical protein DFR69_101241 [Nocardia neocaledoniensis]|uniref:Uncharacterized protein n=1 Tax=Nocardia neocaledoniensis TaxID=236511 RepID=A0A317P1A5_9NOCA|nr:hypothetical protein DFR69_101241 [Nocardia neocaledoniensis]